MAALRQQKIKTNRGLNRNYKTKEIKKMTNYIRITAYHPQKDISAILDSKGKYEKLWQFSAYLIQKGFKIIEVGNDEKFLYATVKRTEPSDKCILRAYAKGEPLYTSLSVQGTVYKAISVQNRCYIPDKSDIL